MDGHPPDIQTPDPVGVGNGGSNGYMALFGDHIYAGGSHGVDLSGTKEEAFSSTYDNEGKLGASIVIYVRHLYMSMF